MLRRVRLLSQIFFMLLFCLLFIKFGSFLLQKNGSGLAWFLRLNPFEMLVTVVASRSYVLAYLIPGITLIVLTIVFGRFFCGMICPLGASIDLFDRLFRGKEKINPPLQPSKKLQMLKYILLFGILVLALLGATFPFFSDPLSIFPRIFAFFVVPGMEFFIRIFISDASLKTMHPVIMQGAYTGSFATLLLMVVIFGSSLFDRRFWCQYVCPTGAFLGLFSRFPFFSREVVTEKCTFCGICNKRVCPTHAITGEKFDQTETSECIVCGACTANKRSCNHFSFHKPIKNKVVAPDIKRRELIAGLSIGLFAMPVLARKALKKRPNIPGPIRPPGAVEEGAFLNRCITCDACISACPENALHPGTISHDGLLSWNTPKLVPRIGYCRKECTRCSQACPTGALMPLTQEQKVTTKIGTAYINRSRCWAWRQDAQCLICKTKCPYSAIDAVDIPPAAGSDMAKAPVVNDFKCIGCGICEYYCPVQHEAAIEVFSHLEKRIKVKTGVKKS